MAKNKGLWTVLGILGLAGGIEGALNGFLNTSLLSLFGSYSNWIVGITGLATVIYIGKKLMSRK